MNASTSRVNRLDFAGRKADAPTTPARRARAAAARAARGLAATLACAGGLSLAAPTTPALAQEYVVGDLPESVAGPDNALVGLPVESQIDGYVEAPIDAPIDAPLIQSDNGPALPSVLANEGMADGDFAGQILADGGVIDEGGASEYVISDDWLPAMGGGDPARCPRWTGQIDALFLFMGNIPNRTLYVDDVTGAPALSLGDAPPAMSAAPRYSLTWHRDACRAFELNYFAVGAFKGVGEAIAPDGSTFSSVGLGGVPFNDVVGAGLETTSGIKSWEFNLRKTDGGPITWIAGFRWVEWTQQLFVGDVFIDPFGTPGVDFYDTSTGNNLYGGQLGADMMLWNRGDRIRINGLAKGGVYYNYQSWQRTTIFSDTALLDTTVGTTKDTVSFVGEVGLVGEYRLTNWLSWRAGYTVFWLGGVANAANQLALSDFTVDPPTTSISPYSSVLLHGATTGLEARW